MNINLFNTLSSHPTSFLNEIVASSLTPLQKRIIALASLAFVFLAAWFVALRCCSRLFSVQLAAKKIDAKPVKEDKLKPAIDLPVKMKHADPIQNDKVQHVEDEDDEILDLTDLFYNENETDAAKLGMPSELEHQKANEQKIEEIKEPIQLPQVHLLPPDPVKNVSLEPPAKPHQKSNDMESKAKVAAEKLDGDILKAPRTDLLKENDKVVQILPKGTDKVIETPTINLDSLNPKQKMLYTFQSIWKHASVDTKTHILEIWKVISKDFSILKWESGSNQNEYHIELAKEMSATHPKLPVGSVILKQKIQITFLEEKASDQSTFNHIIVFSNKDFCHRVGYYWAGKDTAIERIIFGEHPSDGTTCTFEIVGRQFTVSAAMVLDECVHAQWNT